MEQFLCSSAVVESIVINSNSYIDQWKLMTPTADTWRRKNDCAPITSGDVYQFIAILYYMGIVRLASKDDYWSTHDWMPSNHPVCVGMSRNRFRFIWRFFHVNHNDNNDLQASFDREQADVELEAEAEVEDDVIGQEDGEGKENATSQRQRTLVVKLKPLIDHIRVVPNHTFMYLDPTYLLTK